MSEMFNEGLEADAFAMPGDPDGPPPEAVAEAQPERPRDDQGRFTKAEEPQPQVEAEAQPEPEAPTETELERLYAGKYKSAEDLERAYEEAQRKIGEQGGEMGQLRQYVEQLAQAQQQQQWQAQQPQYDWQALVDENPAQAAQIAWQNGNQYAYQQAMQAWDEVSPGAPALWAQNMQLQQQQQQIVARQAEYDWQQTIEQFARENPEIGEIPNEDFEAAQKRNPWVAQQLHNKSADPDARLGALRTLYLDVMHARGRTSDTLVNAAQEVARAQVEATQQAKNEAILASATANTDGGPRPSAAELLGQQWDAMDQPFSDGWLNRD